MTTPWIVASQMTAFWMVAPSWMAAFWMDTNFEQVKDLP